MDFIGFEPAPELRAYLNVGFPWDLMTGDYVPGVDGEEILNGGLMPFTGFAGGGNMYKSTLAHYQLLTAISRYTPIKAMSFDTEPPSCSYRRFGMLMKKINSEMTVEDIKSRLLLTDITMMLGNEWFAQMQKFRDEKVKNKKKLMRKIPMLLSDGTQLEEPVHHIAEVDSLSMMTLEATQKLLEENELGEGGANIEAMKSQGAKTQMLMQIPQMSTEANIFFIMTAHTGKQYQLDPRTPPSKQMSFLKQDVRLKNVPEKFTFLPNNLYFINTCSPMINRTTKTPEFPRSQEDAMSGDTDLMEVTLTNLRGKGGPTGMPVSLMVSQSEGYLEALTALRYCKANEGFGFEGNDTNYYLTFYPEAKLSRTKVRGKLTDGAKLRRAMILTAEICQMYNYWHDERRELLLTPKEVYERIIGQGYDWDQLLETRGYWLYSDMDDGKNYMSTKDLLRIAHGTYKPKWLKVTSAAIATVTTTKEVISSVS